MASTEPCVTVCIPTNGIDEVFPALESIFSQNVDDSLFEVVVTDNGVSDSFFESMIGYSSNHANLVYKRTSAPLFSNQIEAFKLARSKFVKFLNHRMLLEPGALQDLIDFSVVHQNDKPIVYFANGALRFPQESYADDFDTFVQLMSFQSSWSGGLAFWKSDFDELECSKISPLFPHCSMLFAVRDRGRYIVSNRKIMTEQNSSHANKGCYDLFHAFAVEYPSILLDLYRSGDISIDTFNIVLNDNLDIISKFYFWFVIQQRECSYDLSGFKRSISIFYSRIEVYRRIVLRIIKQFFPFFN